MNRIFLIGNGFDLHHGMKTLYSDFIDDYWANVINDISKSDFHKNYENDQISFNKPLFETHESIPIEGKNYSDFKFLFDIKKSGIRVHFKNQFLQSISNSLSINGWVDVEKAYYELLKSSKGISTNDKVIKLNKDFDQIKNLLKEYLLRVQYELKKKILA